MGHFGHSGPLARALPGPWPGPKMAILGAILRSAIWPLPGNQQGTIWPKWPFWGSKMGSILGSWRPSQGPWPGPWARGLSANTHQTSIKSGPSQGPGQGPRRLPALPASCSPRGIWTRTRERRRGSSAGRLARAGPTRAHRGLSTMRSAVHMRAERPYRCGIR